MLNGSRNEMELLAWGSRSRRSVLLPRRANAAARLMAVVVLPTPPFWLVIAIINVPAVVAESSFKPTYYNFERHNPPCRHPFSPARATSANRWRHQSHQAILPLRFLL